MEMSGHDHDGDQGKHEGRGQADHGENALVYWRMLPANRFVEAELREQLGTCISHISAASEEWCRAIGGDAAAAVTLALRLGTPAMVSYRVDLAMTMLLRAALDDAAAATAMAHRLSAMSLHPRKRSKLATSWLLHSIWLDSRRRSQSSDKDGPAPNGGDTQ